MWSRRDRRLLERLVKAIEFLETPATEAAVTQRGTMPTDNTIQAGASGVFQAVPNGALSATVSPVWSASDPAVVITQDPSDASGLTVDVAVPATDTNTSFVLAVELTPSSGPAFPTSITVTIAPVTPPPAPATSAVINQLSQF